MKSGYLFSYLEATMNRIEDLAEWAETTVDYIIEEFVLDDEIHYPTLFMVEDSETITFLDYSEEISEFMGN